MRIAIVGAGVMGFNHARVINRIMREYPDTASLEYIIDIDYAKASRASKLYGGKPLKTIGEMSEDVDLAFIATPTTTHYKVALELIDKGVKYLFIEKPLTNNIDEAVKLLDETRMRGVEVSVGYIERFNPAVYRLLIEIENELGEPLTISSRRIGPFSARVRDTDVIHDLGVHEIDLHLLILKKLPTRLRAYGLRNIVSNLYDHAWISMEYEGVLSSIETNRITPFKLRKLYLTTKKAVAVLDYMDQKLNIYREVYSIDVNIVKEEPLYLEDLFTIRYFRDKKSGLIDQYQSFTTLYLCSKSIESIEKNRELVIVDEPDYSVYSDLLRKGLEGYRVFRENIEGLMT